MREKIAFQGERGANSEIACREACPDAEPVPFPTFEDTLEAVRSGAASVAAVPIENSTAGRVADIHRLLPDSGLKITGEHYLPVRFDLLAPAGVGLADIRYAHSHLMAHAQCRGFLRRNGIEPVVRADTAGAAREIAEAKRSDAAAIASPLAGDVYGLERVARNIQDHAHNMTRFLIVRADAEDSLHCESVDHLTAFVFEVRNVPSALYKALGGFATNGVNMIRLESCNLEGRFASTRFYAEIIGHPEQENVRLALEELGFFSVRIDFLGVFPASPPK